MNLNYQRAPRKSIFWSEKQQGPTHNSQGESLQDSHHFQQAAESIMLPTDPSNRTEGSLSFGNVQSKDLVFGKSPQDDSKSLADSVSGVLATDQITADGKFSTAANLSPIQKKQQTAIRLNGQDLNFPGSSKNPGFKRPPSLALKKGNAINLSLPLNDHVVPVLEDEKEDYRDSPIGASSNNAQEPLFYSNSFTEGSDEDDDDEEDDEDEENMDPARRAVRKRLRKVFYASYFVGLAISLQNRIRLYGTLKRIEEKQQPEKLVVETKKKPFLPLMPTHNFRVFWTILLAIMIVLTTLLTPYDVSFIDENDDIFKDINYIFDAVFALDIIFNFLSAYYDPMSGLITDFRTISVTYLKGWFWIDLIAVLPLDSITSEIFSGYNTGIRVNKLLRLLRFPRLYRLFKILRLFKMLKLFSTSPTFNRFLKRFSMNIGIIKMLKFVVNIFFLNHFVGCLWFFICRLDDFDPDTWVAKHSLVDAGAWTQYVASFYWASQTLTTVGFGDIAPGTPVERIIAILWMIVGVGVYSFTIGNLSSLLSNMDRRATILKKKISTFNNFASKVKIPDFLRLKVQRFFELNHKENVYYWIDPTDMLKHLPENLKSTLLLYSFNSMIRDVEILEMNANFTAILLTHLKLLKLEKREILYRQDDPSQEIYFISKGSIKMVTDLGQGIYTLVQGTYFGELELLEPSKRLCFAQASESSVVIVCDKAVFLEALKDFPDVDAKIRKVAKYRKEKLEMNVKQLENQTAQNVSSPSFHSKTNRKLLKSTDYFYNVLLKHTKTPKKNKSPIFEFPTSLRKGTTKGGSPTNKSIYESKKPFDFSAALENSKSLRFALNNSNSSKNLDDAIKPKPKTLKERILEQQAKEARLNLQNETSENATPNPVSANVNDVVVFNEKKEEELKPNDTQNQANSKENLPQSNAISNASNNNALILLGESKDDSGQKDGNNLFVKTANFLDLVNSDENRAKVEAEKAAALKLNDNKTDDTSEYDSKSKTQTPKADETTRDEKTPQNQLLSTKQKLMNKDDLPDKPAYFSLVHDGINEVRKLKEEAELLYSQMDTKKQNVVEIFGLIAERQIEINTTVEKLFSINK